MTENKPIMIDGVDVSKCECAREICLDVNIICISNHPKKCGGYCKDNPNCLFKQLTRKTQECEELKKQLIQQNDIEKSLLYIWSECVLEIVSVKQYNEIKSIFDKKIKQTITKEN